MALPTAIGSFSLGSTPICLPVGVLIKTHRTADPLSLPSGHGPLEDFRYTAGMPIILKGLPRHQRKVNTVLGRDIPSWQMWTLCRSPAHEQRILRGRVSKPPPPTSLTPPCSLPQKKVA